MKVNIMAPNKYGYISNHKEIIKYWNYEKNKNINPSKTGIKSHKRANWICEKDHEWSTIIVNFLGCPYCKNKKLWIGFNDLKTLFPSIASELNDDIFQANKIIFNSMKIVNWKCSKGHNYKMSISKRTSGRNCPYCSHQLLLRGFNDLETKRPELLDYWDYDANKVKPQEILGKVSTLINWRCKDCNHKWIESPHNLQRKNICKNCKYTVTSHLEKDLLKYIKSIYNQAVIENDRKTIYPKELDIYLPKLNKTIEFNGDYFHSDSFIKKIENISANEKHTIKKQLCEDKNIELAFVWEHDWLFHKNFLLKEIAHWINGTLNIEDSLFLIRLTSVKDTPCLHCNSTKSSF